MFLKTPKASTDQRVRSLLQKAARRGHAEVVELALTRLDRSGDKTWLRSRTVVITFEECWPLAGTLSVNRELSSKREALQRVTKASKQKDAAGLGALAYAYQEGDQSMLDCVPDRHALKIVAEALLRPSAFFGWILTQSRTEESTNVILAAQQYLPAATWQWDKACILGGALLSTFGERPIVESHDIPSTEFPYWVAIDKHTPEGKVVLHEVAKEMHSSYRRLIWASFYYESAYVNQLLPSPWWVAEKIWRLRRAGLSLNAAEDLWARARPLVRERLEGTAAFLKELIEATESVANLPVQARLV
jgi:hypothetical protein